MQKRIKVIRKDKARTCLNICQYLEQKKEASKTDLSKNLPKAYSRVSEAVDWLVKEKVLKQTTRDFRLKQTTHDFRQGRPRIIYTIVDSKWQQIILSKSSPIMKLLKLDGLLEKHFARYRTIIHEIVENEPVFKRTYEHLSEHEQQVLFEQYALEYISTTLTFAFKSNQKEKISRWFELKAVPLEKHKPPIGFDDFRTMSLSRSSIAPNQALVRRLNAPPADKPLLRKN